MELRVDFDLQSFILQDAEAGLLVARAQRSHINAVLSDDVLATCLQWMMLCVSPKTLHLVCKTWHKLATSRPSVVWKHVLHNALLKVLPVTQPDLKQFVLNKFVIYPVDMMTLVDQLGSNGRQYGGLLPLCVV